MAGNWFNIANLYLMFSFGFLYLIQGGYIYAISIKESSELKARHLNYCKLALCSAAYSLSMLVLAYVPGDGRWPNFWVSLMFLAGYGVSYYYFIVMSVYANFSKKTFKWMKWFNWFVLVVQVPPTLSFLFDLGLFPSIFISEMSHNSLSGFILRNNSFNPYDFRMLIMVLSASFVCFLIFSIWSNFFRLRRADKYILVGTAISIFSIGNDVILAFGIPTVGLWFYMSNAVEIFRFTFLAQSERYREILEFKTRLESQNKDLQNEICRREKIQIELLEAKAVAVKASRAQSRFLALINHEIKTPLSCLQSSFVILSQYLRRGAAFDFDGCTSVESNLGFLKLNRYLNIADKNLLLLKSIINNLLDASNLQSMSLNLNKAPTDIRNLVGNLRDSFFEMASERKINLEVNTDEDVGSLYLTDEVRLYQILYNLVTNAIRYTPKGGRVRISVSADPHQGTLKFKVADTGQGIPKSQRESIFNEFVRADNAIKTKIDGLGLGLFVSNKLVFAMGGRLSVKSRENWGSIFCAQILAEPCNVESSRVSLDPTLNQLKVLLVDDHKDLASMLKEMIDDIGGFQCESITCSKAALGTIAENPYDLVISDLMMPEYSGIDVLIRLRKTRGPLVPFILLSGRPLTIAEKSILDIDPLAVFIEKPVSEGLIRAQMIEILNKRDQFLIKVNPAGGRLGQGHSLATH